MNKLEWANTSSFRFLFSVPWLCLIFSCSTFKIIIIIIAIEVIFQAKHKKSRETKPRSRTLVFYYDDDDYWMRKQFFLSPYFKLRFVDFQVSSIKEVCLFCLLVTANVHISSVRSNQTLLLFSKKSYWLCISTVDGCHISEVYINIYRHTSRMAARLAHHFSLLYF